MTNIIIKYFKDDVFFQVGVTPVTVGFLEALAHPAIPCQSPKTSHVDRVGHGQNGLFFYFGALSQPKKNVSDGRDPPTHHLSQV